MTVAINGSDERSIFHKKTRENYVQSVQGEVQMHTAIPSQRVVLNSDIVTGDLPSDDYEAFPYLLAPAVEIKAGFYTGQAHIETSARPCTPEQNAQNKRVAESMRVKAGLAARLVSVLQSTNENTRNTDRIVQAIYNYDNYQPITFHYRCPPTYAEARAEYENFIAQNNRIGPAVERARQIIRSNMRRDLGNAQAEKFKVEGKRALFENGSSESNGIADITSAHQEFLTVFQTLREYSKELLLSDSEEQQFRDDIKRLFDDEAMESTLDEIDRIRDEYINAPNGRRPVPPRVDFIQSVSSPHFSFAELNTGDYSWIVMRAESLNRLEALRSEVGDKPINVESGYRNPRRNDAVGGALLSRHQYGEGFDLCPAVDLDGDGAITASDRDVLFDGANTVGFGYVYKKNFCIHAGASRPGVA